MSKQTLILENIIRWGILLLVFLLPLFFLPLTSDFYEFNKNILLYFFIVILLIVWILKMIAEKKVVFRKTAFDLPVLAIAAAFVVSTFMVSPNKAEAFILPGGTGTILALTILYFIISNNIQEQSAKRIVHSLIASASLLSILGIFSFLEFAKVWNLALPEWLSQKTFSPAGGPLALATFLGVSLALAATRIYADLKADRRRSSSFLLFTFYFLLLITGLGVSIYQLLTTARPILLPYSFGWQIAIETLKFSPLFGVGPASFIVAFNQLRPLAFNLTDLWAVKFGVSSDWYLQLLTTTGVLGLGAWLFLIFKVLKTRPFSIIHYSLFIILLLFAFLPASLVLLFIFYVLLGALGTSLPGKEYSEESRILPWIIFVIMLLASGCSLYTVSRAYAAEIYFKRSLDALSQNKGTETYNLQIKAITLSPYRASYRLTYSQTNLALANSLASKPDLSDQDRQNISILVQQAIAEAKAAVALDPRNSLSWENLAGIYRALINFAQGADSWTISALEQAIALDPASPQLRLSLGGVYYSLQNYDEAIKSFEQTVTLKPNFANGHYNLAASYREKGDFEKAAAEMETTLSQLSKDSDDWQKASSELEALKKKLGEKAEKEGTKPSESLSQPQPLPTGIKPPLTLPTGIEPEVSPTPTP